jgi:hypothetical protein
LRGMGLSQAPCVVNSPRGLPRARWSRLAVRHLWLRLWGTRWAPAGAWGLGLDATSARRRGEKSNAQGLARAPVRSAQAPLVKARGVRGLCGRVWVKVAWAGALWGGPVLTGRCPAERSQAARGRRHPKRPERARPIIQWLTRGVPERLLLWGGDSRFAGLERRHAVSQIPNAGVMTRWRRAAAGWHPAPARPPKPPGRPRGQGARRPAPPPRREEPKTPVDETRRPAWGGR